MAVIINEFEVVVEPPATTPTGPAENADTLKQPEQAPQLAPHDVTMMLSYQAQRTLRVTAH